MRYIMGVGALILWVIFAHWYFPSATPDQLMLTCAIVYAGGVASGSFRGD